MRRLVVFFKPECVIHRFTDYTSVPPNLKFEIDDLEEDWTWSRPFSYIHSRVMTGAVNDWDIYLRKIYK